MIGLLLPVLAATALAAVPEVATTNRTEAPGAPGAGGFVTPPVLAVDPVETEYRRLLEMDDAAQTAIDGWIREADAQGEAADAAALQARINERIETVDAAYRAFLERQPGHVSGRIAFGSFLSDTGREAEARVQLGKALELDPNNAVIHNNLAGIYGHRGPVTNAFVHYERAIALEPDESLYYHNFATTVFLFRKDVREHYGIEDEQRVFDKALGLYRKALELDRNNFILASDLAQTFYGIRPPRHDEALAAWRHAYGLAGDDLEREGILVHLARIQVQAGRFDEARSNLTRVTNPNYGVVKERVLRTLATREEAAGKE
ncbi:MAG: hypothetical protein KF833_23255 [Verrucomicrobiae bacterium]|nr:hypothetical protein [Verrucomicrobiae bacterium]